MSKKEHDSLLHAYMDASGDGYWDWHIQKDYEYMSPRFWEMFGYAPEEKPHSPSAWQDMIFEDDLKVALANFNQHVATHGAHPYEQEVRYRHKNGSTVTVLCRGKVVEWGAEGEPLRMIGTHTDVTALKTMERAVNLAQERFDLAVQGSAVGLWDWDIANNTLYWSNRLKTMLGIEDPAFEPTFEAFEQRIHPEDKQAVLETMTAHLEHKAPYDVEYRLRHSLGHYFWAHVRGQALWNSAGQATRMAGSVDDITKAKEDALNLEKTVEFQRLLMDVNPDLVFVKDRDYKIIEANKAMLEAYPASMQDKIIGYTTVESYPEEEAREFLKEDEKAFTEGLAETIETITFPNGDIRTLFTKKMRFEDPEHNEFILGIARDITTIVKTEHALKLANAELEEFAYRTSHDLRSPLVSSSKLLEIIAGCIEKGEQDKALTYIGHVRDSLDKLSALVADILRLSKMTHLEIAPEPANIPALVADSLAQMSNLQGQTLPTIKTDYQHTEDPTLRVDQLRMVLENLLSNAIKYQNVALEPDLRYLKVATQETLARFTLAVEDNGIGIPDKYRNDVFGMFKRFHSGVSFGSGLGLYMVKKGVQKLGGNVHYEPLTVGSRFVITLPKTRPARGRNEHHESHENHPNCG